MHRFERHSVQVSCRVGTLGIALFLVLASAPALAQSDWAENRGNCETVLVDSQDYDVSEIRTCVQRWESYGSADDISRSQAEGFARGLSRLYYEGGPRDRSLAQGALSRLGLSLLDEGGDFMPDPEMEAFLNRDQSPIYVESVSSRAERRSREHNRDGMREYERGDYRAAAAEFRDALEDNPFNRRAKYNLACQYALLGQYDDSLRELDELGRWDSGDAQEQLSHARTDEDFLSMRGDVRFRLITGFANIQLLNGAGDAGLEKVAEIHAAITEAGYSISSYGYDKNSRSRPVVWFRRGYEDLTETVAQIIDAPDTATRNLGWTSEYDVIVVWGALGGAEVPMPEIQGLLRIEGGDPEQAVHEVVEYMEEVPEMVEDPGGAVEGAAEEWVPSF